MLLSKCRLSNNRLDNFLLSKQTLGNFYLGGTVSGGAHIELIKLAESEGYGGTIYAIASDGTYLYAGGQTTQKVWKINPSNMSKVAESEGYGGAIYAIAFDGTYLYAGGQTTQKVWKMG
jgi:hypothetical protein